MGKTGTINGDNALILEVSPERMTPRSDFLSCRHAKLFVDMYPVQSLDSKRGSRLVGQLFTGCTL